MSVENDIRAIAEQERLLVFDRFDCDAGWSLGERLRRVASERALPVAIDVTLHAMPLFYSALAGSTADNARWIRRKRNVALHFLRSSYSVGRKLELQGATLEDKFSLSDADYAAHGGSFPITVAGTGCIGAVTVSGLPQREDHNLVVEVLAEILGHDALKIALAA
ncbi:heme-degrading domain-containing protein [Rhizobium sp. ZW T2_16]|uniref:heme-degrading domain-containing protein n=1 Tax=Rhizobium sp. ZW T2_16 TaxID=3378083 RepID=UPI003853D257